MRRPAWVVLGMVLLAGIAAGLLIAAVPRLGARGGEFENFHLVGPAGRSYSIESFPPEAVLVIYFGYSTCLRACPTALNRIAEAIDRLGKPGAAVRPIFIDMDPERAAAVSIPAYMEAFGPSFLGLTGSAQKLEQAARSFRVELDRVQLSGDASDYVMKHTSPIFVMRPGEPHPHMLPAASAPEVIEAMLRSVLGSAGSLRVTRRHPR